MKHRTRWFAVTSLAVLAVCIVRTQSPAELLLTEGLMLERAEGKMQQAIERYERVVGNYPAEPQIVARALLQLGNGYETLGRPDARRIYERLVRDFPNSAPARDARARLIAMGVQAFAAGTSRTVLEGPLADRGGSISPDGRYFGFGDETGDLAVYDRETGRQQRLTTNQKGSRELVEYSVFSPDGSRLAYSWRRGPSQYELRVISRSGGRPSVLYANTAVNWLMPYDWSPDGRILVLTAGNDRDRRLMLISATDGSAQQLKSLDWLMGVPDRAEFSPDGRFIAYDRAAVTDNKRGPSDVYAIAVDGTREAALVQAAGSDTFLGWFPDGKSVLVSRERDGGGAWVIPIADGRASGEPRRIIDRGPVRSKGLSVRGDLYYYEQTGTPDIYLATMDPDTGRVAEAPSLLGNRLSGGRFNATWSPTGDRLLFTAGEVFGIHHATTSNVGMIRIKMNYAPSPAWTPDGQAILVGGEDLRGRRGIFRIDLTTADPEPLMLERESGQARLAPDGETLVYRRFLQGPSGEIEVVVSHNIRTGVERELHRRDGVGGLFQLSHDGRFIAVRVGRALQVIPTSGGAARTILEDKNELEMRWMAGMAWSADDNHVLLGRGNDIWRVPVGGGTPQPLGIKMTGIQHISAHPDGRRIAFVSGNGQVQQEIRVIENVVALRERAR